MCTYMLNNTASLPSKSVDDISGKRGIVVHPPHIAPEELPMERYVGSRPYGCQKVESSLRAVLRNEWVVVLLYKAR